jgi:hypothetical protein
MRLFSEKVSPTLTDSPLNIIKVQDFSEIFFGVYEVEINKNKYPVEKISEHNGNPVVSIPVEMGGKIANYPFVLTKGKFEVVFNEQSDYVDIFESKIEDSVEEEPNVIEEKAEIFIPEIGEDRKNDILLQIQEAKKNALIAAKKELELKKSRQIKQIREESNKKKQALESYLESARENLVDEFTIISQRIKKEVFDNNDGKYLEIRETIDNKIEEIRDSLDESLKKDFSKSSQLIDKSIKQLVKDLWENNINPKVDKELRDIAVEIHEKVSEIDNNLNSKLNEKADVSLVESVEKELDAIRDSNIELNNSLNKGVQKALSRVGNVDKKVIQISEEFERKLEEKEQEVVNYFDDKLALVKEETLDITDEARKYFQNLIQESRDGLLTEIRKIKAEKPVEYILETKKSSKVVKDWDSIEKEWNTKIHDKIENVKTDLRKYVTVYASGGGTNATQYQDGGTMNGDLTIVGTISASQYLGIPIYTDTDTLSTVTGRGNTTNDSITVGGVNTPYVVTNSINVNTLSATTLSADRIFTTQLDALSANITVIDIKQYELSGFNVQGNATVQGSISVSGNLTVDTDTLVVDSGNNRVGVGIELPLSPLHVKGAFRVDNGAIGATATPTSATLLTLKSASGSGITSFLDCQSGSGTTLMSIDSLGRIGVGITPAYSIDLKGTTVGMRLDRTGAEPFILLSSSSSGGGQIRGIAGGGLRITNGGAGTEWMRWDSSGNVGIGTATPSARLHTISTTEQVRFGYDVSNYWNATTSSTGVTTLSAEGSGAKFVFANDVEFGANATIPDVIGNTSFADDVEVLGALTAPNQSLDSGSSVLTQELEERSFPNNLWIPWFFTGIGRTGSRGSAILSMIASTAITSANLINDILFLQMASTPWYPSGAGTPQRFSRPFSILFEADSNDQANADKYFVIGKAASTNYLLLPQIGDDCISIKWINNSQIQLNIFYAGVVDQSDPINIPTNLQNKEKYLIVWDGNTLYLYGAFWFGYLTMPKLSLLGSVSASGTLPLSMDHQNFYHAQHYIGPSKNSSVTISSIFMNRKAIHPI